MLQVFVFSDYRVKWQTLNFAPLRIWGHRLQPP